MPSMKLTIQGMHCKSCKMLIEDAMEELGVEISSFQVDEKKQKGILEINTTKKAEEIIKAIEKEGEYKVTK